MPSGSDIRAPDGLRLSSPISVSNISHLWASRCLHSLSRKCSLVFEHLLDPRGILDLIHASLAPDGVLYIEVPNIPAESLLRYPDHVWAPRFDEPHITFFSALTLRQMLTSASFEPVFCDTAGA